MTDNVQYDLFYYSFRVLTDREFASFSLVMEGAPIQIQTIEAFWKCKKYTF